MAQIIRLDIPHVAKKIFEQVDISGLIKHILTFKMQPMKKDVLH